MTQDTKQSVSDLLRESGATAAELHAVAPHLSIHTLRHIRRGVVAGLAHTKPLAAALRKLAKQHRSKAEQYEWGAAQMRKPDAPPPTVEQIVRALGLSPLTLQRANPERLNVYTLHSILRPGKGRLTGNAHMGEVADALDVLAETARQRAERHETAAAAITKHYPVAPVVKRPEPPKGNVRNRKAASRSEVTAHMVWMKEQGKSLDEIGRAHGLTRQAVHGRLATYERQTGTKVKRSGMG